MRPGRCSTCGAEILWLWTDNGRWAPVEKDAVLATIRKEFASARDDIVGFSEGGSPVRARPPEPGAETQKVYVSHFAACPQASKHRRRR